MILDIDIKHVLRCLRGTIAYGLIFSSSDEVKLLSYANSNWISSVLWIVLQKQSVLRLVLQKKILFQLVIQKKSILQLVLHKQSVF